MRVTRTLLVAVTIDAPETIDDDELVEALDQELGNQDVDVEDGNGDVHSIELRGIDLYNPLTHAGLVTS